MLPLFAVSTYLITFPLTWFRIKSNSLWTAVLLHASHNRFIQDIFTPLNQDTGDTIILLTNLELYFQQSVLVLIFTFGIKAKN
jgi:hypothetical protein